MKIKVVREQFQKALHRVNSIVGSRTMLPILGNVLLNAENDKVTLITTDLEVRISTSLEATVEQAGVTTLPCRKLLALVNCFSADEVEITVDDNHHAAIKCGSSNFKLLGLGPEDFPEDAGFEEVRSVRIAENAFKKMLTMISYATSSEDSRKALTGVLCSVSGSVLTMVATDGKRLAMQEKEVAEANGADGDVIIPIKAVNELKRMLENDGDLRISIGDKQCRFESSKITLSSKLVEGTYPNYRLVIPQNFTRMVEVDTARFLSKIETVSQVLSDSSSYIILALSENMMKLQASSVEVGEGSDVIDLEYSGDPIEISFNPEFLADPLKYCGSEKVLMKINDELNPVAIEAGEGFLYVIMPIRKR